MMALPFLAFTDPRRRVDRDRTYNNRRRTQQGRSAGCCFGVENVKERERKFLAILNLVRLRKGLSQMRSTYDRNRKRPEENSQ
ncbi:hypothetical protein HJC23_003395 [Cyclotella cryptica]|uniref:Uncharacterized protein n=1 Tax=Cyclotella cryptica TaxID=29204 RepID=A0ABD3NUU3_9STRA